MLCLIFPVEVPLYFSAKPHINWWPGMALTLFHFHERVLLVPHKCTTTSPLNPLNCFLNRKHLFFSLESSFATHLQNLKFSICTVYCDVVELNHKILLILFANMQNSNYFVLDNSTFLFQQIFDMTLIRRGTFNL